MRMVIAAVGKARRTPEQSLVETYRARFDGLGKGLGLKPLDLIEIDDRRAGSVAEAKAREGEKLLAAVPDGAVIVALDETGDQLSSADLAQDLGRWRDSGAPAVAFLIGGADGLSPDCLKAARRTLSFGRATWPHMLVRAMLAEQLYRAATILAGHPYHRA